jgi:tetratricopeptide (TPR) repeat protein
MHKRHLRVKYLLFISFVFIAPIFNTAQNYTKIDSLKQQLVSVSADSAEVLLNIRLSMQYGNYNMDSAMHYANNSLKAAQQSGNEDMLARAYTNLGTNFFLQGNFNRAIVYFIDAMKHYETTQNMDQLIMAYFNVALIFDKLNNNEKSQEYYFKTLKIVEAMMQKNDSIQKRFAVGRIYNNLGITFHNQKKYDVALDYYNKAISISENTKKLEAIPSIYNNIGNVYKEKGTFDIALSFYAKSLELRRKLNDWQGISLTYAYIGDCYSVQREEKKALEFYEKAYKIAVENQYFELQRNISEVLINENAKNGNYKEAYEMHLTYKKLSDSIDIVEGSRTAAMLEMQYTFDKQQKEVELKKQQRVFRNITLFGILSTLLIVFTLLYYLGQSKMRRIKLQKQTLALLNEKLENDLEYKNKELTTNVMYLLKKNELISSISQRLLDIKGNLKEENKKPVQNVINELLGNVDNDVWSEFEVRFQNVHEDFYKKLQDRFPDLSLNEKKLCAFMRLNMSTKEISNITFQSVHSITIARSRLRKKLNITNNDISIYDFLTSIE